MQLKTLTYTLGVDDLVAFNQHFALVRQKELVPQPMLVRGITVKFAWQLVLWLLIVLATIRFGLLGASLAVLAWFAIYLIQTPVWRLLLRRQVKRLYLAAPSDPILGTHTLTLTDGTLVSRSESGRAEWSCSRIQRVAETPDYVFLYVGVGSGLILPRRQLAPADLSALIASLRAQAPSAFPQPTAGNA